MAAATNLVLGLGNPGPEYRNTRHNAGFMVAEALAADLGASSWRLECGSLVAEVELEGKGIVLAKPQTFMNRSGDAARALMDRHGLGPESLIVVLDDLNLPFGKVRIRPRGSAGGHHGLESVLEAVATAEIVRVRLGIGEETIPEDWREFVLEEFPRATRAEVEAQVARARDAVKAILAEGVERAMAQYNG
jgi:PTH1 family peptidyl-tRNA hydrolase